MWTHQQEAVDWARERRAALLHMGMGTGKSRCALEVISARGHRLVLVCCPKAVIPAWSKQASLWLPGYRVCLLNQATGEKKAAALRDALATKTPLIVVVNYESAYRLEAIEKAAWDCLVYDEVHRLKAPSGVTSRWARKLGKRLPDAQRIGLSGTMISHSPLDAWAIWNCIESPYLVTFPITYTQFKGRFAVTNPRIPGMVVAWRNLDQLNRLVAETTFHRRSEDVLDLPEIMHHRVPVELAPAEARLYHEIEEDFCAEFEQGEVTPGNVLTQLLRLLEICGGHVHADGQRTASRLADRPSKAAVLADLLEDLPPREPVVVFCRFKADVVAAMEECRKQGRTAGELSGSRNELAAWQAGETDVLVANIASGGIGVDLTRAAYGVFYSLGHSLADYLQAIARLHRPGQERTTHFYSLVATVGGKLSVDGEVYEALERRQEVIDAIVGSRRRHAGVGA